MKEKTNKALDETIKMLEDGVKAVFSSEHYMEYLTFISKFYSYSFNNSLLIMLQNPNASLVAGFNDWKNKHKRYVKKGEKGIKIIAPIPYKIKVETPVYDDNHNPVIIDGKPLTETQTVQKLNFKVVSVFDVSQTDGEPLPELAPELNATVENYNDIFSAISACTDYSIKFEDLENGTKGKCFYLTKEISINNGMSEAQNIKTLLHEIAHSRLHSPMLDEVENEQITREEKEVQAESIAFVVANHFGIDTSDYCFDYVANWSTNKELDELKASLSIIQKEANLMIQEIQQQYDTLIQNKEVEVIADKSEQGFDRDMDGIEDSRDSSYTDLDYELIKRANEASLTDMGDSYIRDIEKVDNFNLSSEDKQSAQEQLYAMYIEQLNLQAKAINPYVSGIAKPVSGLNTTQAVNAVSDKATEISNFIKDLEKQSKNNDIKDKQNRINKAIKEAEEKGEKQVTIDGTTYYKRRMNWSTEPPKNVQKYTKEENKRIIENIKQNIPIQDYAQRMGFTVERVGNVYLTLKEHDSVRIDPRKNRFVRNSTGAKGDIIDFVMEFERVDKQTAINSLAKFIGAEVLPSAQIAETTINRQTIDKQPLILPEKAKTMRNIFAYLINTRKIDSQIVSQWIKNGNLYQDTHNNCVFVTFDSNGKPEFASQRGTNTERQFRADVLGSNYDTCHFINNNAKKLIVGEAVIDVMSVQTILKSKGRDLNNYNYLSTNGTTKTQAVLNALKNAPTDTVILATDNDNAGKKARNTLREMISEYDNNIKIIDFVPQNEKDWNAELVSNVLREEKQLQENSTSLAEKISECQRKADNQNMNISQEKQQQPDKQQHNKKDLNLE